MHLKRSSAEKILLIAAIALTISLVVIGLNFVVKANQTVVSPQSETREQDLEKPLHTKPNPTKIEIEGIKMDLPIVEGKIVNGEWETVEQGVSHLDISANPGENGNIVIYGHNKKAILGSLPSVLVGSKIKVTAEDGQIYNYEVYSKRQIPADDISIALATPSEVLTVYTCDGPADAKRYVVQAKLVTT